MLVIGLSLLVIGLITKIIIFGTVVVVSHSLKNDTFLDQNNKQNFSFLGM